jgi:hypothetical protein
MSRQKAPLFPLLEPTQPLIDPSEAEEEIKSRVSWLLRAEKASQTKFFQSFLHSEPPFPATHAAVVRAGNKRQLAQIGTERLPEKAYCRRPELKKLQTYGIVLRGHVPRRFSL